MKTIADVFEIPDSVHPGDFVLRLTEGVGKPERTLDDYVVTPALVDCFEQAMSLIRSAVADGSSKGAFLHGSFGSGKSHFMAVLKLLLDGHVAARSKRALADVVSNSNAWTSGRKFLVVPYHMIGAHGMESAVFGQYARFVREAHPAAPTPGFYRADGIFADARRLRESLGDERFFAGLGAVGSDEESADDGWGTLGSGGWDAASFDAAVRAAPESPERARLVGDLVDTHFSSLRGAVDERGETYLPLDEGLAVMAQHARDLGYDALVLFLDELILWLASHAANTAFLGRESQKIVKLVEANTRRPIPIVSFIARQRDLRELVAEHIAGAEQKNLGDVLSHWSARFASITLEDRNLPLIAEQRLLRPKSAAAREAIDDAFAKTAKARQEVLSTLLTRDGDPEMFRRVYPFSPALVQTLIAVSSLLQRERTALKIMQQILVEQRDTLALGEIVPVGDLYDLISRDDLTFAESMRSRFEGARKLYEEKLLPMLEVEQDVTREDVDAGRVDDERKVRNFRNDDRLIKTLLLSALAEGAAPLRALTPARLAALNHGAVRTPVPGNEAQRVLTKLRGWAGEVGEIRINEDGGANPTVSLQIIGIDTDGILENVRSLDNHGNRVQKVREIIYRALEIDQDEDDLHARRYTILWRGTRRSCELLYANIRALSNEQLKPAGEDWRIVIDYPFDIDGRGRSDDRAKIQKFENEEASANTLVWLPAFLTLAAQTDLGKLVLLDQVLSGNRLNEAADYLSQSDREQARVLLANQRDQLRQRVTNHLLAAYDISRADTRAIDASASGECFLSLNRAFRPETPVGAHFKDTLEHLFGQALAHGYPDHPEFPTEVRRPALRRVLELVRRATEVRDGRVEVDKPHREEVRGIVVPLRLGSLRETHFVLGTEWKDELGKKQRIDGAETPTVGQLRRWIDDGGRRGLSREVENLVINAFALQTNRSFFLHGGPVEGQIDRLEDEIELRAQALPDEALWAAGVERAGKVLGIPTSSMRNAQSVAALTAELKRRATERARAVDTFRAALRKRLEVAEIAPDDSERYRTAEAAAELLSDLESCEPDAVIETLAQAPIVTSQKAMSGVIGEAERLLGALERVQWRVFPDIARLPEPHVGTAQAIVARVHDALRRDEHVTALGATLAEAQSEAIELLSNAAVRAPAAASPASGDRGNGAAAVGAADGDARAEPTDGAGATPVLREGHRRVSADEIEEVFAAIRADVEGGGSVELRWTVRGEA